MGILNYLKGVFGQSGQAKYSGWLANSQPIFTSFGRNIYLSDYVNNAIDRVASEISKIDVKSIVQRGEKLKVQNDELTRLFRYKPNPLQTTSDFLSSIEWLRRKNRNAFIYPQYTTAVGTNGTVYRNYTAFYPLNPTAVYIGVGDSGQVWQIKMDFEDGSSYTLPYSDLIHMRWRRGANLTVGGGDDNGLANDYDMLRAIDALDKTVQGLPKSIEASLQVKGVFHAKSLMDQNKLQVTRDNFEEHILTSKGGMIATDLAGEFTPVDIKAPDIPEEAMKFLKAVIQERYGISAAVISGDYTGEQHSAFYQTAIEDFIVQFQQAFTACLFSARELDVGHQIRCYYSKINYMDTAAKNELSTLATNTGLMTLNKIADMYGMEPFEGGDRRIQSLNFMNVNLVDQYQLAQAGANPNSATDTGDANKQVDAQDVTDTAEDIAGKTLNGAQTQSLITVISQYAAGTLTLGQAVNVISVAIGVSKEDAQKIVEGAE